MITQDDHVRAMFTACKPSHRRVGDTGDVIKRDGCTGRVFWGNAEPQWMRVLGFVGICSHCGTQWFTSELLGRDIAELDRVSANGHRINGYKRFAA
jgi:hypothetical protein